MMWHNNTVSVLHSHTYIVKKHSLPNWHHDSCQGCGACDRLRILRRWTPSFVFVIWHEYLYFSRFFMQVNWEIIRNAEFENILIESHGKIYNKNYVEAMHLIEKAQRFIVAYSRNWLLALLTFSISVSQDIL